MEKPIEKAGGASQQTKTVLQEFTDANTNIEESDFVRRRKEEAEQAEKDLRKKARKLQEDMVHDIVSKSEKKRELLNKRLDLINPHEDKIGLIESLRNIQEAILSNTDQIKNKEETNILSKKIQEHKVLDLYELLVKFEDLKNQITYAVVDFKRNLEIETTEIDGRTEPYLASSALFDLILDLLSKLEKMLSREDFLKIFKDDISRKIIKLNNPDIAEKFKKDNKIKEDESIKTKEVIPEEGRLDLKKIVESREANERTKFKVLFEQKIKIPLLASTSSLLKDCNFQKLDGEIELKVDTINSEPTLKIISFPNETTKQEMEESFRQNGLRFANLKEFLVLLKDQRNQVLKKTRKDNQRLGEYGLEWKMTTKLVSFENDKKIGFSEFPEIGKNFFWNDKVDGFDNLLFSLDNKEGDVKPFSEHYVVANVSMEEVMHSQDSSENSPTQISKIEIEGVPYEFGPVLGKCYTEKEALKMLKYINSELKPGEKPWRFPTTKDFDTWNKVEQKIQQKENLSQDQKNNKIINYYKLLGFTVGASYMYKHYFTGGERKCIAIFDKCNTIFDKIGINLARLTISENYTVKVIR